METGSLLFQSEVEIRASGWLLCFSDLQLEPQYLSLGFYYSCYTYMLIRHAPITTKVLLYVTPENIIFTVALSGPHYFSHFTCKECEFQDTKSL